MFLRCPLRSLFKLTPNRFALPGLAAFLLVAQTAFGSNILFNPSFEQNSGHTIPSGWTRFAPPTAQPGGNYWIEGVVAPQAGSLYFKEWGASYVPSVTNAAGIYQDFGSAAGNTYQASGYFLINTNDVLGADCYVWIEVLFLGSSSNLLALYKSANFNANVGLGSWFQYQVTNACDITSPVSIGDPYFNTYAVTGAVSQIVAPPGAKTVRYRFVYVQAASEGGSCYFDSAVLDQTSGSIPPVIVNLFPLNMIFVNPNDGISFTANSPSGNNIPTNNISLILNGANVTSNLVISGVSSNRTVTYHGLASNATYTASITVTDALNFATSLNSYFETMWAGVQPVLYVWEAEDFDFTNGMHCNNPTLCNTPGNTNCYFGKVGVEGVDEHNTLPGHSPNAYRSADAIGSLISGDYNRPDHYQAGVFDYRIDPFNGGMWLNYTREWTNGSYWLVGRVSTDFGLFGTLTVTLISNSTTTSLGTFTINGGQGWSSFEDIYLKDTNGNNALVNLKGKETIQVTSGGNLLPNFFMLVVAQPDLPVLSKVYPTGTHPFEFTNTFGFTVTATGSSFPANGLKVTLDGFDITSNLTITGSTSSNRVVYTNLLPNAIHTAILSITNALGHGIKVTNNFDTFNEANYMVEAEDFDYNGGQHFDNTTPPINAYSGVSATTNIDYQHAGLSGECCFNYRSDGIPTDRLNPPPNRYDWVRSNYVFWGGIDYVLTFYGAGDWGNYTHLYPAGSYYAYIRTSGGGPFTMYLDQVISGTGTPNQVTSRLGTFAGVAKSYISYDWAQLTDVTLSIPAVVTLNGLSTLRLTTTGNCNPNFFMLVPASGVTLKATRSAGNTIVSFPTQAGVNYRVFYRTNLAAGNWTLMTTILGDGSVKSLSDPAVGGPKFYRVFAP